MNHDNLVALRETLLGTLKPKGNDPQLLDQLCIILHRLGDYESIFRYVQDVSESYYVLGRFSELTGEEGEALRYFIDAINLDKTNWAARNVVLEYYKKDHPTSSSKQDFRFATVINCSSLDEPFIDKCIGNIREVSEHTAVMAYDRLFSGSPEGEPLAQIFSRNQRPKVEFRIHELPSIPTTEWFSYYNRSRLLGYELVRLRANYTLFIDGDEIADPKLLRQWLTFYQKEFDRLPEQPISFRFSNYWYFREPIFQSLSTENSPIMVNNHFMDFLLRSHPEGVARQTRDRDFYSFTALTVNPPLFHHFSWVGDKQRFLAKIKNSAHLNEIDWINRIEREFQHPFNGTDFIHGYQYRTVPNQFGIQLGSS